MSVAANSLNIETAVTGGRLVQRMLVPAAPESVSEMSATAAAIVHVAARPVGPVQRCIACNRALQDNSAKASADEWAWYPAGRLVVVRDFITQLRPNHLPFFEDEQFCERGT